MSVRPDDALSIVESAPLVKRSRAASALVTTVCAVLLAAALGGCRRADATSTVVDFWAMGREGEVVEGMVPEFERQNPGVHVRVQQVPWSAAHEKLLTAFVGDTMPDVFQAGTTWVPELQALGALERLDDRLRASHAVDLADVFDGIRDAATIDGGTWAVPWYVDTRVLFYRSDLLRAAGYGEAPRTWQAWRDAMAQVKARAGAGAYAILLPITEWELPVILGLQRGATLLRDGDRFGAFTSPAFRDGFAFYADLFARELAPVAGEAQVANLYQDFAAGYFAFYVSGPWNLGEFTRRLPATLAGSWATAPMPSPTDEYPGTSLAGGASLAIVARSPRRDAAWRWVEYLADPARQREFHRRTGDLPARRSAWDDPALRDGPHTRAFWAQLARVQAPPKIPEWERIASKIGERAEAAIRGRATVDATLAALDADVDGILEKRRWMLARHDDGAGR